MKIRCYGCTRVKVKEVKEVPCPLVSLKYLVSTDDLAATVEAEEVFMNPSSEHTMEVKYQHPIDPNCVITSCEMVIDKRVIKCVMKPKDEARDDYEDAMASGQSTILAEVGNKTDTLLFNIGLVPPETSIIVRLTYLVVVSSTLGTDFKGAHITIPQTIIPTYEPIEEPTPLVGDSVTLKSQMSKVVPKVTVVPSDDLLFEIGDRAKKRDIVVSLTRKDKKPFPTDTVKIAQGSGTSNSEDYALAIPVSGKYVGGDGVTPNLLFLVDCSGSMRGSRIQQAERCMKYFVQSIPEGTKFNIIRFGSTFRSLFTKQNAFKKKGHEFLECRPLSSRTLESARAFVSNLSANLNGTNLKDPLEAVKNSIDEPTQIIVLTDGAVKNTIATLKTAYSLSKWARISAIGLGNGCSRDLIEGLARFSSGSAHFVQEHEIAAKVASISQEAQQPVLEGVCLSILRDIEGFKPCFPTHGNYGISMLPSESRSILFGFAPKHFDASNLGETNLRGGIRISYLPESASYLMNDEAVSKLSLELLRSKTTEFDDCKVTLHKATSEIVRSALGMGMSADSLTNLFPEPIVINKQVRAKKPIPINVALTSSGKLILGSKSREYSHSDIFFPRKKIIECVALKQPDGSTITIDLTSPDKQKLLRLIDFMPQKKGDMEYTLNGDEVHKVYKFEVVKDHRLHQLAAAKRIREIEDMIRIEEWSKDMIQEAVRLSLTFNVLSKYTSFVAVDEDGSCQAIKSIQKVDVNINSRQQKLSLTSRRSDCGRSRMLTTLSSSKKCKKSKKSDLAMYSMSMMQECCAESTLDDCLSFEDDEDMSMDITTMGREKEKTERKRLPSPSTSLNKPRPAAPAAGPVPDDIIFLQSADGSWKPSPKLFSLCSVAADYSTDVFAVTALVINYLEKHFSHLKSEWFLVVSKAISFLEKNNKQHLLTQ